MSTTDAGAAESATPHATVLASLAALGVVFGDIGASPLHAQDRSGLERPAPRSFRGPQG